MWFLTLVGAGFGSSVSASRPAMGCDLARRNVACALGVVAES